ncbi:MFS transporter [Glycomyces paridis]|uniref:MFS transporter n=1 Tax=Glycomyces paridis TaxID=2126555 RepID=A0A4S8NWE9_9ACTN|nr:MFS transporter [Glycomyces paridis]THV21235.1 MFS transporter [Glycomyces paridis]
MSQAPAPSATRAAKPNGVIAVLAFAGIVVSLMQTFVIPLLPELPELLDASAADTSWAVTATLLAGAIATPVVGRLGDMFGKRRMLLVSLGLLTAGSVVAALRANLPVFIAGRALQGLAAGVIPLGISIMRDELPKARLAGAMALMSASLGIGGALGLPAAALLADHADWHVLFWVAAGAGLACLGLVAAIVPESDVRSGGRFDLVGALGLSAGLFAMLLAISKGADWGWTSAPTLGLAIAAVVILLAWGAWELRARQPLVDLRTTVRRQVLVTNLASVVFGFAMLAMSLVLPQLLQLPEATGVGFGQSMLTVGLVMAPSGLVMMAMSPISARITNSRGPKTTLMAGAVIVAAAYALAAVFMAEIWQLVAVAAIMGAGMGLAYGAMPALIIGATPVSETAAANSLNTLMRSIGTSVSSAVAGVILAHMTADFGGVPLPTQDAFRLILGIASGAALVALAVAAFLPGRKAAEPEPEPVPVAAAA